MAKSEKVLITVLTYPHPSEKYEELVCTAGINESGEWVRLYPIDYRYRPRHQQFHKFQWVEVELAARSANKDPRKESRSPVLESIKLIGEPLGTAGKWRERRQLLDKLPHHTLKELEALYEKDKTSLGLLRPATIHDLVIEPVEGEWKASWKNLHDQLRLFPEMQLKTLEKLPWKWSFVFSCQGSTKKEKRMIEDWEIGALYLNEKKRLGDERKAAESVRNHYLNTVAAPDRDVRFIMGTRFPYNTWLIIGVFWPPKVAQQELFLGK